MKVWVETITVEATLSKNSDVFCYCSTETVAPTTSVSGAVERGATTVASGWGELETDRGIQTTDSMAVTAAASEEPPVKTKRPEPWVLSASSWSDKNFENELHNLSHYPVRPLLRSREEPLIPWSTNWPRAAEIDSATWSNNLYQEKTASKKSLIIVTVF